MKTPKRELLVLFVILFVIILDLYFLLSSSKFCHLALAEHCCRRLVHVENRTLQIWAKYPAVLMIDHGHGKAMSSSKTKSSGSS